jgi:hypothetical protein
MASGKTTILLITMYVPSHVTKIRASDLCGLPPYYCHSPRRSRSQSIQSQYLRPFLQGKHIDRYYVQPDFWGVT